MAESQAHTALDERLFDDPSQLSQLLRQRAGSDRALRFTTSTESHRSGTAASIAASSTAPPPFRAIAEQQQQPVAPASTSRHAPAAPRRVAPIPGNVKPALSTHHSAPTSTGFVRDMDAALRMHRSFGGMDAPGDTQPDSQIYKQYTSGIHGSGEISVFSKVPSPKSLFTEHVEEDEGDSPTDGVGLVESSQEHQSPNITSPALIYDDDSVPALAPSLYAPTSPFKFETPAIAGRKRDNSGHMLSSAVRTNTTPGTVESAAAFPGFGVGNIAPMSLTQAWQNTQAPTSPAMQDAGEDMAFTRPSPNFTHARHSSPMPALSSPIKAMRDDPVRTDPAIRSSSEPRAEYVSMKESQERRKHTGQQPATLVEQDSWEKPSAAQLRNRKKKAKEDFDRETAMSFAFVSAPMPPSPESVRKRSPNSSIFSPIKKRPFSGPGGDERAGVEFAHVMSMNELHDGDSPDELSPDRLSTTRASVKHNIKDNGVQVPKTSSHPNRTQSQQPSRNSSQLISPSSQLQRESQFQTPASQQLLRESLRPHSSRDSVAIMDSQPDATANYESIPRPKSLRFLSSPSTNQYSINQTTMATKTGWTGQVISSSMPPMPPGLTPEETMDAEDAENEEITPKDEEGVPSSPPITTNDDDITYDEHERGYDEYGEDTGARDSVELEISDERTPVEEEDDLPIAKAEPEVEEDTNMTDEGIEEDKDLDLVEPEKLEMSTDHELPETLEQENPQDAHSEGHESSEEDDQDADRVDQQPPRVQRQDTVPETDALEETQPSFLPNESVAHNHPTLAHEHVEPNRTNSTGPFNTAQEQVSDSQQRREPATDAKEDGSDDIQMDQRIRSLQDIFNMPDTQQSTGEEEIEMPRLSGLTDDENLAASSSPARPATKRRRITYASKRTAFRSPHKPTKAPEVQPQQPPAPLSKPQPAAPNSPATVSTQQRELDGADAALQAREEARAPYTRKATLKTGPPARSSRPKPQKKGALKPVSRKLLDALSSPAISPSRSKSITEHQASTPVTPSKGKRGTTTAEADVDMPDVDDQRDELADPSPEPVQNVTAVEVVADSGEQPEGTIIAPNRVFASWPGSHFYPAICLGRAGRQLQIRFDDGNTTSLEATQVRALDLHPGDLVKVDEPGLKKHSYVVVGFRNKIKDVQGKNKPTTDQRGYTMVILEEKRRDSLPAAKVAPPVEHISVSMASVYLTTQLWTRLRDRAFTFSPPNSPIKSASRTNTPINVDPLASPSFSRRGMTLPSLLKGATGRAASVASSSARSSNGVFSNMAFVLTSTAMDVDKEEIARTIKSNGGLVLEQGFHELFDHEANEAPTSSQSLRRSASVADGTVGLELKPAYKDLGFVALISDSHSRSTKYIQALALNVPCLHLRWVQDSLNTSRAAPFDRYLLPAGVSKFLDPNGVVRSRTMTTYDPAADDMSFAQTVSDRDLLLRGQTVLLVTGKSKKEIEKRQPFIFLTHALGSATVGRCADLAAATELLKVAQWDWIYVDNGEAGVADAAAGLFGTGKPAASGKQKKSKKRKRDEGEEELVARGEVAGKKVKITCAEFVIQSLILGALIEE